MPSRNDIERLRREADTIMTRIERVQSTIERARTEAGEHWDGGLELDLETPRGDSIEVAIDIDESAAENAQKRYERAKRFEDDVAKQEAVVEQLAVLPADPLAYLICYHLDAVGGNYPKSIAGHLDATREDVDSLCQEMVGTVLERVESGTVKQRNVKAKQADEVRQHHTYYRLSREGDHLLRFLGTEDGKRNVLRHLSDGRRIAGRIAECGPVDPRSTAEELGLTFEQARHCCRALRKVGLLVQGDDRRGSETKNETQSGNSNSDSRSSYSLTDTAARLLDELG